MNFFFYLFFFKVIYLYDATHILDDGRQNTWYIYSHAV